MPSVTQENVPQYVELDFWTRWECVDVLGHALLISLKQVVSHICRAQNVICFRGYDYRALKQCSDSSFYGSSQTQRFWR